MEKYPAIVLAEHGELPRVRQVTVDPPQFGEVCVRVMASGICHTDLAAVGDARSCPVVLGHEGAGIISSVGEGVEGHKVGDHVVINWQPKCGNCRNCTSGRRALCDDIRGTTGPRIHLDGVPLAVMLNAGTFCPYVVVPAQGAVRIRQDIPFDTAALLGCSVATGMGAVLNGPRIFEGDSVVIIGVGGVGLNSVQAARRSGAASIIAIDRDPGHLALAEVLGASHTIDSSTVNPVSVVTEITGGRGADHVFEVSGNTKLMSLGLRLLGRGGTLTLVGAAGRDEHLTFAPRRFMSQQQTIRGCIFGDIEPQSDIPLFADWLSAGILNLEPLSGETIELSDVPDVFAGSIRPGIRTVVSLENLNA